MRFLLVPYNYGLIDITSRIGSSSSCENSTHRDDRFDRSISGSRDRELVFERASEVGKLTSTDQI